MHDRITTASVHSADERKASFNVCVGPEAGSVRYACALSVPFICVRFGSFQFGRTKWHV